MRTPSCVLCMVYDIEKYSSEKLIDENGMKFLYGTGK